MKFKQEIATDGEWTDWITPIMTGYKMACCDCGLVHNIDFQATKVIEKFPDGTWDHEPLDIDDYRIQLRVSRNNRSTGQIRRHMNT